MIDRKSMMGLLGALPDEMLMKALAVAGAAAPASGQTGFEGLSVDDNKIEPWNEKVVPYGGGKDRPALVDKMWSKEEVSPHVMPTMESPMDGEDDPYLQTGNT